LIFSVTPLFSVRIEEEFQEWNKFRRALRKEDQQVFDQLFEKAKLPVEAGGNTARPWPFETILISILLNYFGAWLKLVVGLHNKSKLH